MIRKTGNQYCVYSKEGKKLSCHGSRGEAERRLAEIEYFAKNQKQYNKDKKGGKK